MFWLNRIFKPKPEPVKPEEPKELLRKERKNNVMICCGMNAAYFERGKPYIESLCRNTQPGSVNVFCIDYPLNYPHPGINRVMVDSAKLQAANGGQMLQNGEFIEFDPSLKDDDVIVFTDCDMLLQRPLTELELDTLEEFPKHAVGIALNQTPDHTLEDERKLINQQFPDSALDQAYPGWRSMGVFNCGVLVARVDTYRNLRNLMRQEWSRFFKIFPHRCSIQWLICYLTQRHFNHVLLPQTFHAHGHFGIPEGVTIEKDEIARFHGEVIAFRHAF